MSSYACIGAFDKAKAGHDEWYFSTRLAFLDMRGKLQISPLSHWGYGCKVITQTHDIINGEFNQTTRDVAVIVDDHAWITSFSTLYKCHVKHHAIVSIGSVVADMQVEPYTVVAGNPARQIAHWDFEKKRWISDK